MFLFLLCKEGTEETPNKKAWTQVHAFFGGGNAGFRFSPACRAVWEGG